MTLVVYVLVEKLILKLALRFVVRRSPIEKVYWLVNHL